MKIKVFSIFPIIRKIFTFSLLGMLLLLMLSHVQPTAASEAGLLLFVNTLGDFGNDTDPGDDACKNAVGDCTLRAAIEEINANSSTGLNIIGFDIPGNGPHTIYLTSELPAIDDQILLDGTNAESSTSCPSGVNTPASLSIVLHGLNAGTGTNGITLESGSDGSIIQGLAIVGFDGDGIHFEAGADNVTIRCNHIGINRAGNSAEPNNRDGISGSAADFLTIGGTSFDDRNVISGNGTHGVGMSGTSNNDATFKGNFVGTDATGTVAIPNGSAGVIIPGDNAQVGGTTTAERNVISGNGWSGLRISGYNDNWTVVNNYIGVDVFGTGALGNGDDGIFINYTSCCVAESHTIGEMGAGNVIANNGGAGILIEGHPTDTTLQPNDITIRYNSIYNNGGLGIDLSFDISGDGVTANDGIGDPDFGPNTLLNFPTLSDAFTNGVEVNLTINYAGDPGTYGFDFYINDSCDPSGNGEGQTYAATAGFFTGNGNINGSVNIAAAGAGGKFLTAVTIYGDNSSEFSNCIPIADASAFVVNDNGDDHDANTNDGRCDTDNNPDNGDTCSLRAVIEQVNALNLAGGASVTFDIPTSGIAFIKLEGELPDITNTILLDATTQPGATCTNEENPGSILVQLDGATAGTAEGLHLATGSDGSLVRGFSITNFDGIGMRVNSDNNTIQCNYIGMNPDGDTVEMNNGTGMVIFGDNNLVGGTFILFRNLISGNNGNGISIATVATGNDIYGNIIGLDAFYDQPRGNTFQGIRVFGSIANDIGGSSPDLGNYIGANAQHGIRFDAGSQANDVWNNRIGVDRDGNPTLGNGFNGIVLTNADFNDIGFSAGGDDGNLIAGNGQDGILLESDSSNNQIWHNYIYDNDNNGMRIFNGDNNIVDLNTIEDNGIAGIQVSDGAGDATGNRITRNSIYGNAGMGIDLEADGLVEVNDMEDSDNGANTLQNYPVLTSANDSANVIGFFNSESNTDYTLQFFSSPTCDSNGYGEGQTYLDDFDTTTDNNGNAFFNITLVATVNPGDYITAIAYNSFTGDTSEFSACEQVPSDCIPPAAVDPTISVNAGNINLSWNTNPTSEYQIHRAINDPYFTDQLYDTITATSWNDPDSNEVGNPAENHYYFVVSGDTSCFSAPSQTLGEFDFAIVPGTP